MQKVVTRVGICGCVVTDFTKEVNALLEEGFFLESFDIDRGWFRIVCTAILNDDEYYDDEDGSYSGDEDYEDDEDEISLTKVKKK